ELASSIAFARRPPDADRQSAARPPAPAATTTTTLTATSATATTTSPPATTTTTPKPSVSTPPPASVPPPAGQVDRVVALVNEARVENGCVALRVDDKLTAAATQHSDDMSERDYFSHTTPEGVSFDKRIENAGYQM